MTTTANSVEATPTWDRWLYQQRSAIKQRLKPVRIRYKQFFYIGQWLRSNKPKIVGMLVLTLLVTAVEVSLPILANAWQQDVALTLQSSLLYQYALLGAALVFILLVLLAANTYVEQNLVRLFINELRLYWFQRTLKQTDHLNGEIVGQLRNLRKTQQITSLPIF